MFIYSTTYEPVIFGLEEKKQDVAAQGCREREKKKTLARICDFTSSNKHLHAVAGVYFTGSLDVTHPMQPDNCFLNF